MTLDDGEDFNLGQELRGLLERIIVRYRQGTLDVTARLSGGRFEPLSTSLAAICLGFVLRTTYGFIAITVFFCWFHEFKG